MSKYKSTERQTDRQRWWVVRERGPCHAGAGKTQSACQSKQDERVTQLPLIQLLVNIHPLQTFADPRSETRAVGVSGCW